MSHLGILAVQSISAAPNQHKTSRVGAKIEKFGESAKEIPNFFTFRHEKALQISAIDNV